MEQRYVHATNYILHNVLIFLKFDLFEIRQFNHFYNKIYKIFN